MRDKTISIMFFIVIMISIISLIGFQYKECKVIGGEFVRGLFWFECINISKT